MQLKSKASLILSLSVLSLGIATPAAARAPYLSISSSGDSLSLSITSADSTSAVEIDYGNPGSLVSTVTSYNWMTDYAGNFSTTLNARSFGILPGASIYVVVNGQRSDTYQYNPSSSYGNITFSNQYPSLTLGQTLYVSIYNTGGYSGSYYVSANTNSSAASASISGGQIALYGQNVGTAAITICQNVGGACGSLTATVTNATTTGTLTFSQNPLTLTQYQSSNVNVYSSYNNAYGFYVASNPSPNVVTASVSGMVLSLTAGVSGTSSIQICQNVSSYCGTLQVTVTGGGYGNLSLSQSALYLTAGQSTAVTIYGTAPFYLGTNSNPQVATANVSGSTLSVYAGTSGTTTMNICQNSYYSCASLMVTVSGRILGETQYANGQLLNRGGAIFIVYKNTLTGFQNARAFLGLGYRFADAYEATTLGLWESGRGVTTANGPHPFGAWIKSGQTVYFVHENGLIPVPDWNTFLQNNGQARFIVEANSWDFQKPLQTIMAAYDSRLQ